MKRFLLAATVYTASLAGTGAAQAQPLPSDATVFAAAAAIQPKVVAGRRDIHEHPELSNQEVRTAKLVADHLRRLGFEVRTGVAKNGVIGILRGGKPGRTIALRADMDALPVAEKNDLSFASKAMARWRGEPVPVMRACGHDAHVARLVGAAEVLASMKVDLAGTAVFVFQPAEEGAQDAETCGEKTTQDHFRRFMMPGMDHCGGGEGAFVYDYLGELDKWVGNGNAPASLTGFHPGPDGKPKFSATV